MGWLKELKKNSISKTAMTMSAVTMAAVLSFGTMVYAADTSNYVAPENETFEIAENIAELEADPNVAKLNPEDVLWPDIEEDILEGKDVVNILLIGQDKREGETRQRSDTIILATLNMEKNKISITSFMRDLYVQIPGYSDNRINAAYPFGGMELLDEVIETNFGVKIDGNIEVDFSGFQTIIDMLGGVDIELSQAEADYLCGRNQNALYPHPYREDWQYLTEGVNTLNGEQALLHSRNRSIGNSDYERTERQREVLLACFEKVKETDMFTLLSMVDDAFDMITTDLSHGELLGYAMNVFDMGFDSIESYRIPQDGAYSPAVIRQMQVLVPDLAACRSYLTEIL